MFNSTYEIIQFIVGLAGSLLTIGCFLPQGIKTVRTKDTSGISLAFPIIALTSSLFWITAGLLMICSHIAFNNPDLLASGLAGGIPIILTNVVTIVINAIITIIKLNNMKEAKKQNISEAEYCLMHSKSQTTSAN